MRTTIDRSSGFKRDYKREFRTHGPDLSAFIEQVLAFLLADVRLPDKHKDHKLFGEWEGCRECHVKPNLLLVYEKPDDETLKLVRLGSHAEVFGM
jgi:mRNA interferase YafQ